MGLKLFGSIGSLPPFCGNRIIAVLRVMDSLPFTYMWLIAFVIRGAKDCQKVLKNLTVKTLIPGSEFGFMSFSKDYSSSFSVKKPSSSIFSSSGICLFSSSS